MATFAYIFLFIVADFLICFFVFTLMLAWIKKHYPNVTPKVSTILEDDEIAIIIKEERTGGVVVRLCPSDHFAKMSYDEIIHHDAFIQACDAVDVIVYSEEEPEFLDSSE